MGETIKTVAILAATPALSSILAMVLAADRRLRVREFASLHALTTYMSLSEVDLVVCDFDSETDRADAVATALRADDGLVRSDFHIVALTRTVSIDTRQTSIRAGIDEVIVKPMSPRYLHERILSRLRPANIPIHAYHGLDRRRPKPREIAFHPIHRLGENVVRLFPDR